jgi:predicted nucleotidyltransferase
MLIANVRIVMKRTGRKLPEALARRDLIAGLAHRIGLHPAVERVWLYGSRARGDNFDRSDIDLAVEAPAMKAPDWLRMKFDLVDEAPTLLLIDLIRLEEAPDHLREQIRQEGVVVYERSRRSSGSNGCCR